MRVCSPMSLSLHTAHLLAYVALAPYGSLSRLSLRDTPLRLKKPVGLSASSPRQRRGIWADPTHHKYPPLHSWRGGGR